MAVAVVFFALAEVDAPGQFADDVEVDAAADVGFEGGDFNEGVGGEVAGAQVSERVHFFAELEEALLRADGAGAPFLEQTEYVSGGFDVRGRISERVAHWPSYCA